MDPITTAAVGGAVLAGAKAANMLAKNEIVKALILPTAKAIGDDWKEKFESARQSKRQENLRSHVEAVQSRLDESFSPDPLLTEKWIEGAENVDPVDEELAAAWRGVLLAIGAGQPMREQLLDAVRSLTPYEAKEFIGFAADGKRRDGFLECRSRLQDLGLLVKPSQIFLDPRFLSQIFLISVLALLVSVLFRTLPLGLAETMSPTDKRLIAGFLEVVPYLMGIPLISYVAERYTRPRMTSLGTALAQFAKRASRPAQEGDKVEDAQKPKPRGRARTRSA